jgi:hypothetical protein
MSVPLHETERQFRSEVLYRDARGYVWQRMRNGAWRSTDGLTSNPGSHVPGSPETGGELPKRWGPYTEIREAAPLNTENGTGGDEDLVDAAWRLIASVWDGAGREHFADWLRAASAWRDRYNNRRTRR